MRKRTYRPKAGWKKGEHPHEDTMWHMVSCDFCWQAALGPTVRALLFVVLMPDEKRKELAKLPWWGSALKDVKAS
jgi:hypothetical protein